MYINPVCQFLVDAVEKKKQTYLVNLLQRAIGSGFFWQKLELTPDMNSYKLTLRKIESLPEASFHDALLAVILVTTMLFRVFFRSLDREKTWYALNDRLCGKQPRKFSEGSFFQLFPD